MAVSFRECLSLSVLHTAEAQFNTAADVQVDGKKSGGGGGSISYVTLLLFGLMVAQWIWSTRNRGKMPLPRVLRDSGRNNAAPAKGLLI